MRLVNKLKDITSSSGVPGGILVIFSFKYFIALPILTESGLH